MKKTLPLYEKDPYLKTCKAKVISVENNKIVLDESIFFPEGGGQPSDIGKIIFEDQVINIDHVFIKNGIIYHQANKLINNINIGLQVKCVLDWDHRFTNMQRHCGEHILSAAFYDLFGGINRGFHMGEDYMTIDISLETMDEYSEMTDEMIEKAEWEANVYVWNNLPVSVKRFATRDEALKQPMRKQLDLNEDIVIVCVGDENKAAGCVACCGTHPNRTGEVGLIKVYRWENYKGMQRITFDAGSKALKHVQNNDELVKNLSIRYSSEADKLIDNILIKENKAEETRQTLYEIKQAYFKELGLQIQKQINVLDSKVMIYRHDVLKIDDFLALSKLIEIPEKTLVNFVSERENTNLLLSDGSIDCNKIVKDNAPVWRGKGGGRSNYARATFPTKEDLDCFLDYLYMAYL